MAKLNHFPHEIWASEPRSDRRDLAGIPSVAVVGYAKGLKGIDPQILIPTNMLGGVSSRIHSGLSDMVLTPIEIDTKGFYRALANPSAHLGHAGENLSA
jgi:hypothetical protein